MKILIDIGHPAHVHYFKNAINILSLKGHTIYITARNKDVTFSLLTSYKLSFFNRGKGAKTLIGKFFYLLFANSQLLFLSLKFKPDIFLSFTSPYAAQVSWILRKPHISFDDTEHAKLGILSFAPFTKVIITPNCFTKDFGNKHIRFRGYMELCYLHPNHFKPDKDIYRFLGINVDDKYIIIRFVSWEATHDKGHKGLSLKNKIKVVDEFSKYAKVFISSECKLPEELENYRIQFPPEKMHDALYYAELLFGESATMASECSILGTPSIFIDNNGRGYTNEQEFRYQLVHNYTESDTDQEHAIRKGVEILKLGKKEGMFSSKSRQLINESIDVTAFMVWFVENYPKSIIIMKENPCFQSAFNNQNQ